MGSKRDKAHEIERKNNKNDNMDRDILKSSRKVLEKDNLEDIAVKEEDVDKDFEVQEKQKSKTNETNKVIHTYKLNI